MVGRSNAEAAATFADVFGADFPIADFKVYPNSLAAACQAA
ncbi:MAG: hypothetical protein AAFW75_30910 [Cyanobacteria bacterium J06636_16]